MNLSKILRRISTSGNVRITKCEFFHSPNSTVNSKYSEAIKEAERVVGYSASFLNMRWTLSDQILNSLFYLPKLVDSTDHPVLEKFRNFLLKNAQSTWGLIVLLISKIAGLNSKFPKIEYDSVTGLLHRQRVIAEATEMMKVSDLAHKAIINIDPSKNTPILNSYNKLALLCGDYLLSMSFDEIAHLKNWRIQEILSTILRDLSESQFIGLINKKNKAVPSRPLPVQRNIDIPEANNTRSFEIKHVLGNMKAEWTLRNILGGGNLLGKCCECSLILANHGNQVQEIGYILGRNLVLAWQASLEKHSLEEETFSLFSAPVMFHLEHDPSFYAQIEKGLFNDDEIDYDYIRKVVNGGPGLEKSSQVQQKFSQAVLKALDNFPESESKTALIQIIDSF